MSVEYEYIIQQLTLLPSLEDKEDVVVKVIWTLKGVDGANEGEWSSSTDIPFNAQSDFIPYEDLTQAEVESWLISYTPPDYLDMAKAKIVEQLNTKTEPEVKPLPWQSNN